MATDHGGNGDNNGTSPGETPAPGLKGAPPVAPRPKIRGALHFPFGRVKPEDPPAAPPEDPPEATTIAQRFFLRVGLASLYLMLALWTLVVVLLLRVVSLIVGGWPMGAAHDPDVFAEMYWLGMPAIPAALLGSMWGLRRLGRSWLTTLTVSSALAALAVLVPPFLDGHVGPHELAWFTQGLHRVVVVLVPLAMLAGFGRLLVTVDRLARRGPFRAGATMAGSGALAAALAVTAMVAPQGEAAEWLTEAVDHSFTVEPEYAGPGRPAELRGLYLAYAKELATLGQGVPMASGSAGDVTWGLANSLATIQNSGDGPDAFSTCIEDLFHDEAEQQRHAARRAGLPPADVEDLVMTALLEVCDRHARGMVREPRPYLQRTVRAAVADHYRAQRRYGACALEPTWDPRQELSVQLREVQRAVCSLDDRQRTALEMWLYEYDYAAIAAALDVTEVNARKLVSRARSRIQREVH